MISAVFTDRYSEWTRDLGGWPPYCGLAPAPPRALSKPPGVGVRFATAAIARSEVAVECNRLENSALRVSRCSHCGAHLINVLIKSERRQFVKHSRVSCRFHKGRGRFDQGRAARSPTAAAGLRSLRGRVIS